MATAALSERLPTEEETRTASEAVSAFGQAMMEDGTLPMQVQQNGNEVTIELPPAIGEMMLDILAHVANGSMLTVVPYGAELTTQQAADILNFSRPHLIKLLNRGDIPHHRVGKHRRIRAEDLLAYKEQLDEKRSAALSRLQRLGQEFDADDREAAPA